MLENKPIGFVGKAAPSLLKDIQALKEKTTDNSAPKKAVSLSAGDFLTVQNHNNSAQLPFEVSSLINFGDTNVTYSAPSNLKRTEIKNYKIDDQGDTNSCGTTSLTSVLNHFGANIKDHFEIDKSIRSQKFDMFTAPGDIVSYANSKGFNAGLKKDSNVQEVASFIDKGIPVMALIDSGDKYDFNMHWIVITGYEKDDKGKMKNFVIADPSGGYTYTKDIESFTEKWSNIQVGTEKMPVIGGKATFKSGYNNLIIPIAPKNKNITLSTGKTINSKDIKIPNEFDTIQGYGSRVVSKGAIILERTVGLGQSIYKTASNLFK